MGLYIHLSMSISQTIGRAVTRLQALRSYVESVSDIHQTVPEATHWLAHQPHLEHTNVASQLPIVRRRLGSHYSAPIQECETNTANVTTQRWNKYIALLLCLDYFTGDADDDNEQ